jgi:hypothetical protein
VSLNLNSDERVLGLVSVYVLGADHPNTKSIVHKAVVAAV